MRMLWKNIKGLVGAYDSPPSRLRGSEMADFPLLENAWLAIDSGKIADFGPMETFPGIVDWTGLDVVDCEGRYVLPSWCDSHTHLVFAAPRSHEFMSRLEGKTYQQIADEGGGILNSARALQLMPEDQLFEEALVRLQHAMQAGTGAIEIKSGYGLDDEAELKMLRIIQRLKEAVPIPVRRTFLACHAVPEGNWTATTWTRHVAEHLLPRVQKEKLADYVDAFCEKGYFGLEEVSTLLEAASKEGLAAKVHVNQFNAFGGVKLCTNLDALTVDHLEVLEPEDLEALKSSSNTRTMACALPGCSYFLGIPYTPVRELIKADVAVALATDFNPGSAPSSNMERIVQLAILKMKMLPLEAIAAATLNGAAAMEVSDQAGVIAPGRAANVLVTKPMQGLEGFGYDFGESSVEKVFIDGVEV